MAKPEKLLKLNGAGACEVISSLFAEKTKHEASKRPDLDVWGPYSARDAALRCTLPGVTLTCEALPLQPLSQHGERPGCGSGLSTGFVFAL